LFYFDNIDLKVDKKRNEISFPNGDIFLVLISYDSRASNKGCA